MDDARHVRAVAELDGQHGPAAAVGHERLLQVVAQLGRAGQPRQLVRHALPSRPELVAQPAQERRGVVAQARTVLFHAPVDLARDGGQRRVDGGEELCEERRRLLLFRERAFRGQGGRDRRRDGAQLHRLQRAAAFGAIRGRAHVFDPAERRRRALLEQGHRLARPRLPRCDLAGVRRRHEPAGEVGSGRGHGSVDEPLDDQRVLEHGQRPAFHAGQLTPG